MRPQTTHRLARRSFGRLVRISIVGIARFAYAPGFIGSHGAPTSSTPPVVHYEYRESALAILIPVGRNPRARRIELAAILAQFS